MAADSTGYRQVYSHPLQGGEFSLELQNIVFEKNGSCANMFMALFRRLERAPSTFPIITPFC
jgi:hypothetical protein